jgi:gliding motility-associated-like protein
MLVVTSANGCVDTAYINVEVIAEPSFYNIITPDGNGQNDVFEILNAERIPNELVVFNRWGKKVYEATNYQNDWDGGDLSDGTYYYIFIYGVELQNEYQGTLTIMRK